MPATAAASKRSDPTGTLPQKARRDFSAVGYDEAMRRARDIVPILRGTANCSSQSEYIGE